MDFWLSPRKKKDDDDEEREEIFEYPQFRYSLKWRRENIKPSNISSHNICKRYKNKIGTIVDNKIRMYWNLCAETNIIRRTHKIALPQMKIVQNGISVFVFVFSLFLELYVKCRNRSTLELCVVQWNFSKKRNLSKALQIHYGLWTQFFFLFPFFIFGRWKIIRFCC